VAEAVLSGKKHVSSEFHSLKPLNKDTNSDGTHFLDELRSYIADKQQAQQQIGDPLHTHDINAILRIESQRVELQRQQDGVKLSKLKKALSEATLLSHKLARLQMGARTARTRAVHQPANSENTRSVPQFLSSTYHNHFFESFARSAGTRFQL
jgi:hypothetical protein